MKVCFLGNAKSVEVFKYDSHTDYDLIATSNAGLVLGAKFNIKFDYYWCQDPRMFSEKGSLVFPYLNEVQDCGLIDSINSEAIYLDEFGCSNITTYNVLGNVGFSLHPEIGIFTGFNSLYGFIQIMLSKGMTELHLYGVEMDYVTEERFYERGVADVSLDLHRQIDQLNLIIICLKKITELGVNVFFHGCGNLISDYKN